MPFPLLAALAPMMGAGANVLSTAITNNQNKIQAQKNRDFQENMSSTAHQREVADLKAAGINPLLSANNGASSPQGSMATLTAPDVSGIGNMFGNVMEYQRYKMEKAAYEKNLELTGAQIGKTQAETKSISQTERRQEAENNFNWKIFIPKMLKNLSIDVNNMFKNTLTPGRGRD